MLSAAFEPFVRQGPAAVMFRLIAERVLSPARLEALFAAAARRQRPSEALFSTCVDVLGLVVAGQSKSVRAAYLRRRAKTAVGIRALYDKLAGIETNVSERFVATTAAQLAELRDALGPPRTPLLAGYEVRVVDGNYLAGTQHRPAPLRGRREAVLPGLALAIYDPERRLVRDVLLSTDGHLNERTLLPRLLERIIPGQCWIADRNFATHDFLAGIVARGATFVVRQHGQTRGTPLGPAEPRGRTATGALEEERLRLTTASGPLDLRRITLTLDAPNRNADREVKILTNLPATVSAAQVAELYHARWRIEAAFMHLATALRSEVDTLAYPEAALFGFAIGLVLYDILRTLEAALRAAHPRVAAERLFSLYYLGEEIAEVTRGMLIAIDAQHWRAAAALDDAAWRAQLSAVARSVDVKLYFTEPRRKKKPPNKPLAPSTPGGHLATQRILRPNKPIQS